MGFLAFIMFVIAVITAVQLQKEKKRSKELLANSSQNQQQLTLLQGSVESQTQELQRYRERYSNIISVDDEIDKRQEKLAQLANDIATMRADYANKKQLYDNLKAEVGIYEEKLEFAHVGMYEPHFDFGTSEKFKDAIFINRDKQKKMVQAGNAVVAHQAWTLNGSEKEGAKMTKQAVQLTTRSFNNECDVAIANTTWKNVTVMEERIRKAFEVINKFNQSNQIDISYDYLTLKLEEIRLVYEYKQKLQSEKEAQAEARRQEKEEEQVRKEAERALQEEKKLQDLLAKIQQKANNASGEQLIKLNAEIATMGEELKEMQRKNDRVKAMAEQTKLGYVYIISNIGSFGENVYKIGMTRRLEPMDRINELGSASVPFYFDVHAMIFSEDAPALEANLQRAFADRRVNLVNPRKEFFNVSLEEIKKKVYEFNPDISFTDDVEAKEYYQSLEIRNQATQAKVADNIPNEI